MKGYLDMKAKGTLASKRCVQECHEWFPFTVTIAKEVHQMNLHPCTAKYHGHKLHEPE